MKKITLVVFLVALLQHAFSQVSVTNLASPYLQDFNSLANTGTSNVLPLGWFLLETGTSANDSYGADNGITISGNTYSYGATGNTERAFGSLLSGSNSPIVGVAFTNNTAANITSISISYTGEQWRLGATAREDRLDFSYSLTATSLNTGTWVDVDNLDLVAPVQTGTAGALNGNDAANQIIKTATISSLSIAPGTTFYLRWVDFNAPGSDDGLGIDDISVSFNGATLPPCTAPTAQPTNLVFGAPTTSSINATFNAANPVANQYLVVLSTSNTLGAIPQNNTAYTEGDVIGNGTVVGNSSATSINATSLSPGTQYYLHIFSVNSNCSGGPLYNSTSPLTGSSSTTTPPVCATPTGTPGALTFNPSGTSISGSFAAATGADSYLVIRSTNSTITFSPVNGANYTVGQTVGTGNTGVVVKAGEGTTFSTTGLTINTTYYFFVYAISNVNCTGGPLYNTTATTGNTTTTAGGSGAPPNYYTTTSGLNCADLKTTLKNIISTGNTPKTYGDLWGQYTVSDIKPREVGPGTSATVIWDIYSDNPTGVDPYNFTPGAVTSGGQQDNGTNTSTEGQFYNREHTVPLSWFSGSTSTNGPATDYLHIFPTDKVVNATRSNYIYGEVATATSTSANGSKLGSSANAGFSGPVFEPINEYKGDVARAFLYFVTRYQDNMPGWPGGTNGTQAFDPTTYPSVDVPYLQLMIKWHNQDPVSAKEIDRNNAAYSFQGNRNPYIDSPQFVNRVWNSTCAGLSALPVNVVSFGGKYQDDKVMLVWKAENELNFDRFEVERSINGITYLKIAEVKSTFSRSYGFDDNVATMKGQRIYYRLKQVDRDGAYRYSAVFTLHIPLQSKLSIFPNPATNFMQLKLNSNINGTVQIRVTDNLGKMVQQHSVKVNGNAIRLETDKLPNGSYLVIMYYNGEQYFQKVLISK